MEVLSELGPQPKTFRVESTLEKNDEGYTDPDVLWNRSVQFVRNSYLREIYADPSFDEHLDIVNPSSRGDDSPLPPAPIPDEEYLKKLDAVVLEEAAEEVLWQMAKARIRTQKMILEIIKIFHLFMSGILSLALVFTVALDWLSVKGHTYDLYIVPLLVLLLFVSMQNIYAVVNLKLFCFGMYSPIPIIWVLLTAMSPGHCRDPLMCPGRCESVIHHLSAAHILVVFFEYCVAAGIHTSVVLELNRYLHLTLREMLNHALYNYPLLVIVIFKSIVMSLNKRCKRI
ncbi:hypothetical protein TNIN_435961 [Trichonephila inaurata madagascariensis]|uniref:Uncharacterized protein n=1 Tax=Trichonephila inaurata madagascariensis TaxID=2747483 RepID=A0A8X6XAB2_9ARAC|nr:hypothetical protein TNIN_435961 [Trichonephila inaurata madagascariensis]